MLSRMFTIQDLTNQTILERVLSSQKTELSLKLRVLHTLGRLESKILWEGHWEFTTLVQNETKQEVMTLEVLLRNYNFPSSRKNYRTLSRGVLFISVSHKISQAIPLSLRKRRKAEKMNTVNCQSWDKNLCLFLLVSKFLKPPRMGIMKLINTLNFRFVIACL